MDNGSQKFLDLSWQGLFDQHDKLDKVLLCIKDESLERSLQSEIDRQKLSELMETVLHEIAKSSLEQLRNLISRVQESLSSENLGFLWKKSLAFSTIHSLKGEARVMGLSVLISNHLHELESQLGQYKSLRKYQKESIFRLSKNA